VSAVNQLERQLTEMDTMMRAADTRSQEQLKVLEKNNKLLKTEKDSLREVGARHCMPIVWDSLLSCATFLVELSLRDLIQGQLSHWWWILKKFICISFNRF